MRATITLIAVFLVALAVFADSGCRRAPGGAAFAAVVAPHIERVRQHVGVPAKQPSRLLVVFRHPDADEADSGHLSVVARQVAIDTETTLADRTEMMVPEPLSPTAVVPPNQDVVSLVPSALPAPQPERLLRPPRARLA